MLDQYTKKWTLLIKRIEDHKYITPFIKRLWKKDIRASVKLFWDFFQWNFVWIQKSTYYVHASFELLSSWQTSLSRGGVVGSILMDLSKVYDCLKDDLLLAKPEAYGYIKNV